MPTEKLERSDAILQLGRKIAFQLTNLRNEDIISAWMGHHIAELISAAGNDPSNKKLSDECVSTILGIWAHRSSLPDGARPFEDLESVVRTLEALDPESSSSFFARDFNLGGHADLKGESTWISLSRSIDRAARVIIQCCLEQAVTELAGNSAEWAKLAKEAGVDLGIFEPILLLSQGDDEGNAKKHRDWEEARIKSRIEQLELILKVSAPLKEKLQRSLIEREERS